MTFQHFLDKLKSSCVEASLASWNAVKIGDGDKSCETNRALRGLREQRGEGGRTKSALIRMCDGRSGAGDNKT